MTDDVLVADDAHVRVVTISHPAKKNALTRAMLAQLAAVVRDVPDSVRVLVLRGDPAGGAFSAGFDIGSIDADEKERGLDPIEAPASALETCGVPVIAGIDGACMGGALELAMACTIRVASPSAKLAMPPARLGLVYSARGLARFLRAVSPSQAQRMFLTGERIDVNDALRVGLVDVVAPDAFSEANRLAALIAQNAPLAVSGMLDAIRRIAKPGGPDAADVAAVAAARDRTLASRDLAEGVAAFAEKRPPAFTGE